MNTDAESALAVVSRRIGDVVSAVERILYEFDGVLEENEGEVQIRFGPEILRFRCSADGELVEIAQTAWDDPFEARMSSENVDFVRAHGRWRLVDVSTRANYQGLLGSSLTSVLPLTNRFGNLIGVQLQFRDLAMNVFVHADAVYATWGQDAVPRWGHEWTDE